MCSVPAQAIGLGPAAIMVAGAIGCSVIAHRLFLRRDLLTG
jgi:hypothetical protein